MNTTAPASSIERGWTFVRNVLAGGNSRQGSWILPLAALMIGFAFLFIRNDVFRSPQNLSNVAAQAVPLLIVAIGQMIVVLLAGLDLSVGSVVSLTTVILAEGGSPWVLIPLVLIGAAGIGMVNGLVITRLNVHPIIATLSMQWIVLGIALWIRPIAGGDVPQLVKASVTDDRALIWLGLALLAGWKILHGSRFGLHLFAIGGGVAAGREDAARAFGIADRRVVVYAYVLSSTFAAVAGIFLAGRIVSGDAEVGSGLELLSIIAVALGGAHLTGGVGSLPGTCIGVGLLALISNGMNLEHISAFQQTIVTGVILLIVVVSQRRKQMGL